MRKQLTSKSGSFTLLLALVGTILLFAYSDRRLSASAESSMIPQAAVIVTGTPVYLPLVIQEYPKNTIFGYEYSSITTGHGVELMRTAGANWVRRAGIWWPDVEPTKGTYDWSQLSGFEAEFQLARSQNMEVVIIVRGTPSWAQAAAPYNRTCGRIKTSEYAAFATFLAELITRYSYEPYNVKYWELYNEPDVDPTLVASGNEWMGCWGEIGETYYGGGIYADMLQAVYPAAKIANPDAQILVGGLLLDCDPVNPPDGKNCTPSKFLEGILVNGGGPYFDGVSFHAYDTNHSWLGGYFNPNWSSAEDTTGPSLIAKADYLQSVLADNSVNGKYLMNTEAALLCLNGDPALCETTKAYYVVHSYVTALKENLKANLWYFWLERNSELFETDLTPLPAYTTYTFARKQLRDAVYSQEITVDAGVRVYELTTPAGTLWVMWSLDGNVHNGLALPSTPDAVYDAFGTSITPGATIDVDIKPLYVRWDS